MKTGLACVMLLAVFSQAAMAAQARSISLSDALDTAFAMNPDLAAARQEIDIAQGERQQAGLMPNPELSWEMEDTRKSTSTTTIAISQALELGGKRGARIDVASRAQDVAALELEQRGNALRGEVVQAFFAASRAQAGLDLALESRALAERGLQVAEGRIRAGKSSPVEATRAQVQLAETRLQVRQAQIAKSTAWRELSQVMGQPESAFESLQSSNLSPGNAPHAPTLLNALKQTAELRLAETRIALGDAQLGSQKAQRIPDLTVSLGSQYSREDRERVNVVGFSVPIPLFDRNQGNVLAAARRADQSRDLRNAVELKLRTQTQVALDQWSTASQEAETFTQVILPAAQQAVDTATRGFEMGKFGFLEVLDAQRTLIAARSQYLESLARAVDARVVIERIYGDSGRLITQLQ
ncbi:Outer membrane efflux protein [Pseudomonas cichorii]|uniref:Outer membrane efflux protein n=1 Tax=Pseudomonas cichorii TaxID=36746 RepID=A0A3M4LSH0_PSECI|nr:TolC family protein [Pseudomonas cichorii]RMQ44360.1 Outer membrane efflux protein [Pseudomonas cichorii]